MDKIFPESKELEHILRWHEYSLYDITITGRVEPLSWDEIIMKEPAQEFLFGNNYLLVPIPGNEETTLKEAYVKNRSDGYFPVLRIPEVDIERKTCPNLHGADGIKREQRLHYFLHELYFNEDSISAFSSPGVYLRYHSRLVIPTEKAVEIFGSYFAVAQFTSSRVNIRGQKKKNIN